MPDSSDHPLKALPPRRRRHLIWLAVIRAQITVAILVAMYYLLPIGQTIDAKAGIVLFVGLVLFVLLVLWHLRKITQARYPAIRAVEALATLVPLFLLVFSTVYLLMAANNPRGFSEPLSRTDALYFTVTVFATVGFGDITPTTAITRIIVIVQMLADLLVLGLLARVLLGAVRRAQESREPDNGEAG